MAKFCVGCGTEVVETAEICPQCGTRVKNKASDKNRFVAILLCGFFGFLGLHKFYLGENGWGIVYLLTGGLLCIGAIIDFIALLVMSDEKFAEKYH